MLNSTWPSAPAPEFSRMAETLAQRSLREGQAACRPKDARYPQDSLFKGKVQLAGIGSKNQVRKLVRDGVVLPGNPYLFNNGKIADFDLQASRVRASGVWGCAQCSIPESHNESACRFTHLRARALCRRFPGGHALGLPQ